MNIAIIMSFVIFVKQAACTARALTPAQQKRVAELETEIARCKREKKEAEEEVVKIKKERNPGNVRVVTESKKKRLARKGAYLNGKITKLDKEIQDAQAHIDAIKRKIPEPQDKSSLNTGEIEEANVLGKKDDKADRAAATTEHPKVSEPEKHPVGPQPPEQPKLPQQPQQEKQPQQPQQEKQPQLAQQVENPQLAQQEKQPQLAQQNVPEDKNTNGWAIFKITKWRVICFIAIIAVVLVALIIYYIQK